MREERLVEMVNEAGMEGSVIPSSELHFVPNYRVFCEENRCGNYNKNYGCPPYCGTVEEMRGRTMGFENVLVIKSSHESVNAMDEAQTKPLKKAHNQRCLKLLNQFRSEGLVDKTLAIMAGPCSFCDTCKMPSGEECPFPDKRYSCLSAYCIDVGDLAESAGLPISWDPGQAAFFSLILF